MVSHLSVVLAVCGLAVWVGGWDGFSSVCGLAVCGLAVWVGGWDGFSSVCGLAVWVCGWDGFSSVCGLAVWVGNIIVSAFATLFQLLLKVTVFLLKVKNNYKSALCFVNRSYTCLHFLMPNHNNSPKLSIETFLFICSESSIYI